MLELEEMVRRMVLEGLGVAKYHDGMNESTWHLFRMWEYKAVVPSSAEQEEELRFGAPGPHQDTNMLSVVCQHQVEGLEVQTRHGDWIRVKPSPASLVVMVGNALRVSIAAFLCHGSGSEATNLCTSAGFLYSLL